MGNSRYWFGAVMLFILLISPMPGTVAAEMLSLDHCIRQSLERNPAVLASIERKNQAEWQKKVAHRDFFPMLNMDYSYTHQKDATEFDATLLGAGTISIREHNNYRMGLHIDQPLFTGFKILESYKLADLGLKEAQAGSQLARLEIVYQTTAAYFELLRSIQFQKVKDDEVTMLKAHLKDTQSFYDNEKIPLNDLLQSKVHLANAKQGARTAAALTDISRSRLATIIKKPLGQPLEVRGDIQTNPLLPSSVAVTQKALATRPELAQANYAVEASKKYITLAQSDYYPTVTLQAAHNRYGGDAWVDGTGLSDVQAPDESLIGVYASWKLLTWGQRGYDVKRAKAASREARQQLTGVMDTVALEVRTNYNHAQSTYSNIEPAQLAVKQAQENLKMNKLRYRNQLSTDTDVLDARSLLTETEFNLYAATYDYQIWLAGLARAAGVENWQELQ